MHAPTARAAALGLALLAPPVARGGDAGWTLVSEVEVQHPTTVAAFFDERRGITGGCETPSYSGAVFTTSDAGKTWARGQVADASSCRFGLEALAPAGAWSCGNGGDVRASTDGGRTWTRLADFGGTMPSQPRLLSFADARRGAIATPRELGVTSDGGSSWARPALPAGAGRVVGISLTGEGAGTVLRLVGEEGRMWSSGNAGAAWTPAASPLQAEVYDSPSGPQVALRFLPGGEGVLAAIVDQDGVPAGHVYRTRDGGKTWAEEQLPGGLKPSVITLSSDGTILASFDSHVLRLYRRQAGAGSP